MALRKPATASREERDDSLILASGEATPTFFDCDAMMSWVALNKANAKARLSNEAAKAKARLSSEAAKAKLAYPTRLNPKHHLALAAQAISRANSALLKEDALLNSPRLASSSGAKALSAMPASPCEAKSCGEPILPRQ